MSIGALTSNHVNYLIWRYLQESGHGEAAVKLQRDWIPDPQTLPFAQHIKTHALVVLVQKGLQYYEIEQSINQNGTRSSTSSSSLFFGPQSGRATSTLKEDASEEEAACASRFSPRTRKHGREGAANSLLLDLPTERAAKRSRRSNGTEGTIGGDDMDYELNSNSNSNANATADTNTATANADNANGNGYPQAEAADPTSNLNSPVEESENQSQTGANGTYMEIDDEDAGANEQEHEQQQQQQEDEDEDEDEEDEDDEPSQALVTLTLANGQSVGVQSDKVTELGPESITLTVPDKTVLHTAWNPQDPAIFANGGDALCRIWTMRPHAPSSNKVSTPYHFVDTLDPSDNSFVTAMAWSPSGDVLAVATRGHVSEWTCAVSLWAKSGNSMEELPAAQDMVLLFRWNPSGSHLLGITSSGKGTSALMIWDVSNSQALAPFQLDHVVTDAAWADEKKFFISGHGFIAESVIDGQTLAGCKRREEADRGESWSNILYDSATNIIVFAADESAVLGIIDASDKLHTTTAHNSEMTALAFQPHENPLSYPPASPRLLVTSSVDGGIKVWDAKNPFFLVHILSLGRSLPAMAISFSKNGHLVAAANSDRILIWNAEEGGMPKASWKGKADTWQGPTNGIDRDSGIGEEDEGSTHSLGWNSDGRKLAYGLGSQIAIIDFRP